MPQYILDSEILSTSLRRFVPPELIEEFCSIIIQSKILVAGSWALHLVESSIPEENELDSVRTNGETWMPKDMDLWVCRKSLTAILLFLQQYGKEVTSEREASEFGPTWKSDYSDKGTISRIYQIGDLGCIDVIDINCGSLPPSELYRRFDISICVSYWDGSMLYTYYLEEILAKKMHLINPKNQFAGPIKRQNRLDKYKCRGYALHLKQNTTDECMNETIQEINSGTLTTIQIKEISQKRDTLHRLEMAFQTYQSDKTKSHLLNAMEFFTKYQTILNIRIKQLSKQVTNIQSISTVTRHLGIAIQDTFMEKESNKLDMDVDVPEWIVSKHSQVEELTQNLSPIEIHAKKVLETTTKHLEMKKMELAMWNQHLDGFSTERSNEFPKCGICYNENIKYAITNCGHTYCTTCIYRQGVRLSSTFKCSYCNREFLQQDVIELFCP